MVLGTFKDRSASGIGSGSSTQSRLHALSVDTDSEDDESHTGTQDEQLAGWAYVGSHNFTPSAWGTLSGTVARPILNVSVLPFRLIAPRSADTSEFLGLAFLR